MIKNSLVFIIVITIIFSYAFTFDLIMNTLFNQVEDFLFLNEDSAKMVFYFAKFSFGWFVIASYGEKLYKKLSNNNNNNNN